MTADSSNDDDALPSPPEASIVTTHLNILLPILRQWAQEVQSRQGSAWAKIYLFGSLVVRNADRFDPAKSDIDLLALFSSSDAVPPERVQACVALLHDLRALEAKLRHSLRQPPNGRPIISAGAFTSRELDLGINGSHDPAWLTRNNFLDLCSASSPEPLRSHVLAPPPSDALQAMILCSQHRKRFLIISADGTRQVSSVTPGDEQMKAIGRAAARLKPLDEYGAYDAPSGLNFLFRLLSDARIPSYTEVGRKLAAVVEGRLIPLDASEHLLLWEVLASKAFESVTSAGAPTQFAERHALELASYFVGEQRANAIRLVGAADECFSEDFVDVRYDPAPYLMPASIAADYDARLGRVSKEALDRGAQFFDGPCARLIQVVASSRDASERKHLELHLGPLGWNDFSVADDFVHEAQRQGGRSNLVAAFVNLEAVQRGDFRVAGLPNIIETVTTVVTSDGQLLYSERKAVSTVPDTLSATVSENIHREKDDNALVPSAPDPFRTVLRGIREELSPRLEQMLTRRDVVLLGICFNLEEMHPTMLFLAKLPVDLKTLLKTCREWPGKDFGEGVLRSLAADSEDPRWPTVLASGNWYASGKAGIIRTLEFLGYPTAAESPHSCFISYSKADSDLERN